MIRMKHFRLSEFESPDLPGSGHCMEDEVLERIDLARSIAGIPFVVNSGYRTIKHNRKVGGKEDSAHLGGWAVDIACENSRDRMLIVHSLILVGFTRIGIGKTFVHADLDPDKTQDVMWLY